MRNQTSSFSHKTVPGLELQYSKSAAISAGLYYSSKGPAWWEAYKAVSCCIDQGWLLLLPSMLKLHFPCQIPWSLGSWAAGQLSNHSLISCIPAVETGQVVGINRIQGQRKGK